MSSFQGIEIRRAIEADATAIRELTCAAYAKWIPVLGRAPIPMLADYDRAVREHMIDLLVGGGELAGLIEMKSGGDHLFIVNIAVVPAFQKRGYGRRMLAHAEELARSLGFAEIRLFTGKRMAENVQLYSRVGYQIDREVPFKDTFTVHMSKRIA